MGSETFGMKDSAKASTESFTAGKAPVIKGSCTGSVSSTMTMDWLPVVISCIAHWS